MQEHSDPSVYTPLRDWRLKWFPAHISHPQNPTCFMFPSMTWWLQDLTQARAPVGQEQLRPPPLVECGGERDPMAPGHRVLGGQTPPQSPPREPISLTSELVENRFPLGSLRFCGTVRAAAGHQDCALASESPPAPGLICTWRPTSL